MSKPHSVHGRAQNALAAGHITVFTANCRSAVDRQLRVFSSRSGTLCLIARGLSLSNFTAVQARQIRRSGPTHCARTLRPIYKSWFHKINPARARLRGYFRARKGTSAIAAYVSMPSDSGACSKFIPNQVILKIWIGHLHRHRRCCGALCGDARWNVRPYCCHKWPSVFETRAYLQSEKENSQSSQLESFIGHFDKPSVGATQRSPQFRSPKIFFHTSIRFQ